MNEIKEMILQELMAESFFAEQREKISLKEMNENPREETLIAASRDSGFLNGILLAIDTVKGIKNEK